VLAIGRGTRAALRSENPAVSLDHAEIAHEEGGYTITDLGSITGTYVNGRPVESMRLSKGDLIEIGDLRLEVQSADPAKPMVLRIVQAPASALDFDDAPSQALAATPGAGVMKSPKIDYAAEYRLRRPYLTKAALAAIVGIVCLGVIGEVTQPKKQRVFAPGGVSSAHGRVRDPNGEPLANDCRMCHEPFRGVTNDRCQSCHGTMPHARNQAEPPPCTECHAEHRGAQRLSTISDRLCVTCHSNIGSQTTGAATLANITSFGDKHPDFKLPEDTDTLRLNHRLHLQKGGLFNAQGMREEINCTFCHGMLNVRGRIDPTPIRFVLDCQHCHRLTFDPRFPDAEVPHGGDPGNAYGFILATYAGNRDIIGKSPEELRRILTQRKEATADERALLDAEQVIKVKCGLCHELHRDDKNRPVVTPPVIPTRWMNAKFSHGPHRSMSCEDCHAQATKSSKTSDVMLPRREACLPCHGERKGILLSNTNRSSNCILCHEYHVHSNAAPRMTPRTGLIRADVGGGSGMFESILLAAVVVLLLVVLIPVGFALYQRWKPAPVERVAQKPAAPAPPPPPAPTPARTPPPIEKAPAAPPKEPISSTRLIQADEPQAPAAGATEAVQWYGMLRCTAGPIAGQNFIIEEDGLYIGRDASLSKIVIDDSRVSKRHVRIMPRDGKVWAIDQNSTNGTFLVNNAGRERITEHQLKRGEQIVLADDAATFIYQI